MTIWNPGLCLVVYLTNPHFRGKWQHVSRVGQQKIKYWPIKTRELSVRLWDELYAGVLQSITVNYNLQQKKTKHYGAKQRSMEKDRPLCYPITISWDSFYSFYDLSFLKIVLIFWSPIWLISPIISLLILRRNFLWSNDTYHNHISWFNCK